MSERNLAEPIPIRGTSVPSSLDDAQRALIGQSQDLLCTHDLGGKILSVNSVPADVLGYTVEELLRMRLQDVLVPEYRSLFDEYIKVLQEKQVACGFMTLLTSSGERRIWEYHNVLRIEDGAPIVCGIAHDVTEMHRAERRLRRLADLNHAITDNALEGIVIFDRRLRHVEWNRFMEKVSGITAEEVQGRHVLEVFPFIKQQGTYDLLEKALAGTSVEAADLCFTPKAADNKRWFSTNMSPLRDAQGHIAGVIATLHDVTERKLAEDKLRQSERAASLLWSISHAIENSGSLEQVVQSAVDRIVAGFGCDVVLCFLKRNEKLALAAMSRTADSLRDVPVRRIGECLCGLAVERGKPLYFLDICSDSRCTWEECQRAGIRSFAALPLKTATETIGVLGLGSVTACDFSKDAPFVETLAVELSLKNALLIQDASTRNSDLEKEIDDRKRMQEALQLSEERYRLLAEASAQIVWVTDARGEFHNDFRWRSFTGMSVEDGKECNWVDCVHPDDRTRIAESWRNAVRTGASWDTEYRLRRADGQYRHVNSRGIPLRNPDGSIREWIGTCMDITERKRAEEELFNSRQMLQAVLDNIPQRVFWKNRDLEYVACNKPLALDSGHQVPDDLLGKTDYDMAWAADADRYRADDRRVMETGRPKLTYEEPQPKADGTQAWLMTSKVPMYDRDGKVIGVLGTYEDITERKRAEDALRRSDMQLRSFVENAPYAITRASVHGNRFLEINPAGIRLLGCNSRAEALALNLSDVYADPDGRKVFLSHLSPGVMFSGVELRWKRKDGKPLSVRGSARLIHDDASDEDIVEGIFEDITERRLLEEQSFQSQKMQAIGRLAGGVAHDFNNLLEVILGYAEILSEAEKIPANQQKLEEIISAARRAASLTGQLLAFSRKQVLEFKILSLNSIVSDTHRMLRRLIGEDIRLDLHLDPDLWLVKADPVRIGQVIMNLAVNARDAMPKGGELVIATTNVTVEENAASPASTLPPGSYVMLSVTDTGAGMDPETRAHIFDPFFTTKPAGKGTGLGLATVYGIVQQSSGYIRVSSELDHGARFEIILPRVEGTADSLKRHRPVGEVRGGDETILLAEDSASLRLFLCESLEKFGYNVLPAADGAEALRLAAHQQGPIHLLITDVVMPEVGGPDLVCRIKLLRPDIKVLLMSGYTDDRLGSHPDLDPQSFLQKPFQIADLAQKIRTALRPRRR